jgi:hypothetical protein
MVSTAPSFNRGKRLPDRELNPGLVAGLAKRHGKRFVSIQAQR